MNLLVFMLMAVKRKDGSQRFFPHTFLDLNFNLKINNRLPFRYGLFIIQKLLFSFLLYCFLFGTFQSQFSFSLVSMVADITSSHIIFLCCSTRSHVSFKHLNFSCSLLQQNRDYFFRYTTFDEILKSERIVEGISLSTEQY